MAVIRFDDGSGKERDEIFVLADEILLMMMRMVINHYDFLKQKEGKLPPLEAHTRERALDIEVLLSLAEARRSINQS